MQIELTLCNSSRFLPGKRSCGNRFYLGLQDDTTFTNGLNAMVWYQQKLYLNIHRALAELKLLDVWYQQKLYLNSEFNKNMASMKKVWYQQKLYLNNYA